MAKVEHLLVEYTASQNSAEHYDKLVWYLTSILWTASFALYGLTSNHPENNDDIVFSLFTCAFGFILIIAAWYFANQFREIKNSKYNRCKEIELLLGMRQHLVTVGIHKQRSQLIYLKVMTELFLFAWILKLSNIIDNPLCIPSWYIICVYLYFRFLHLCYP